MDSIVAMLEGETVISLVVEQPFWYVTITV
jgi:hypothetical protein